MLARCSLPSEFISWNRKHKAPFGRHFPSALKPFVPTSLQEKFEGPFALQPNNTNRAFEYPWAFHCVPVNPGLSVLEIGGGLSGFQFAMAKAGCQVTNVDPGLEARGKGWSADGATIAHLNRLFHTSVEFVEGVIADTSYRNESFDRIFSISVLEHLPTDEIVDAMEYSYRYLKPAGFFILTIDLFLDVAPFTNRTENRYGRNLDLKWLTDLCPFEIKLGDPKELFGFSEFEPENILANLSEYLIGSYPALVQCLVLQKPAR